MGAPPLNVTRLRALQQEGPFVPLVLTMWDGRRFSLAGPHEFLVSPDGRSVAVCEGGGLEILKTSEISELEPGWRDCDGHNGANQATAEGRG